MAAGPPGSDRASAKRGVIEPLTVIRGLVPGTYRGRVLGMVPGTSPGMTGVVGRREAPSGPSRYAGGATDRRPTVPCFSRRLATMPDFFAASTNSFR